MRTFLIGSLLLVLNLVTWDSNAQTYTPGGTGTSNFVFWLDASEGVTNSPTVDFWIDQTGNGNDNFSNGNDATVSAGAINGQDAILFDGGNDEIRLSDDDDINSGGPYSEKMIHIAFQSGADITTRQVLYEQSGNVRGLNMYIEQDSIHFAIWPTGAASFMKISRVITAGTNYIATFYYNTAGDGFEAYVNGTRAGSITGVADMNGHSHNIGIGQVYERSRFHNGTGGSTSYTGATGFGFGGLIAEILYYNDASQTRRILHENYLSERYGVAIANDFYAGTLSNDLQGIGILGATDSTITSTVSNEVTFENVSYLNDSLDYFIAAHNNLSGVSSDAGTEGHSNRLWEIDINDAAPTADGNVKICFDPTIVSTKSLTIANFYLRNNGGQTELGNATQEGGLICFDVSASSIDGDQITLGNTDTTAIQPEICGDGIDNDSDGLIDCFDPDCGGVGACADFYYNPNLIPGSCQKTINTPAAGYTLTNEWQTNKATNPVFQLAGVRAGDMNGDGSVEVIGRLYSGSFQIFDGADGSIDQTITPTSAAMFLSSFCIGDVDNDGLGDIFHVESPNILRRYEYNTVGQVWASAQTVASAPRSPQLADFDEDGIPEVYVGDRIYNAITGVRLVIGSGNSGFLGNLSYPIAYNIFNPGDAKPGGGTFGSEAEGLEFIAGNEIYTVDLGNGTIDNGSLTLASTYAAGSDGLTVVGDLDLDGLPDIVYTKSGTIDAWNPRTQALMSSASGNYLGRPTIADFDNDGLTDVGVAGTGLSGSYQVLEYSGGALGLIWANGSLDVNNGYSGATVFDLQGDGINEVVFTDDDSLYIWSGADGSRQAAMAQTSGKWTDMPIIVDVDGDQQAEIVMCGQDVEGFSPVNMAHIQAVSTADHTWQKARPVWNQQGYFNVNVYDDLSIPAVVQDNLLPAFGGRFNNTMSQASVGLASSVADAQVRIQDPTDGNDLDLSDCGVGSNIIRMDITLSNYGEAALPVGTDISYYNGNPTLGGATLIKVSTTTQAIGINDSLVVADSIPDQGGAAFDLYIVFNHDGTAQPIPLTGLNATVEECDSTNNMFSHSFAGCGVLNNAPTGDTSIVNAVEDVTYTFTVADFTNNYTDADGDPFNQIRVTNLEDVGTLLLSGLAVALNDTIDSLDIASGNLTYQSILNENGNDYDSLRFEVGDGTDFSAADYLLTINVSAVNDAPTADNNTVTTDEDVDYVFTVADFMVSFADVEGDNFNRIQITAIESTGDLELSGGDITIGQIIDSTNIANGNLIFKVGANDNGASYDVFSFKVGDANDLSAPTYTLTIDVDAVNDAPSGASNTVATTQDNNYTFASADFGVSYSDIETDPLNNIIVTSLETVGDLELNGSAVNIGDAISVTDIDLNLLVFIPLAGQTGSPYDSFGFKVDDGSDSSSATYTLTINVTSSNAPPVLDAIGDQAGNELTNISFTANAPDPDLDNVTYTIDAASIAAGMSINPTTGLFSWTPMESQAVDPSPTAYSVTVTATDDGTPNMSDSEVFTINVSEVNTAPYASTNDTIILEGDIVNFNIVGMDDDTTQEAVFYQILDIPTLLLGASVNFTTGEFNWVTTENDGPGVYQIVITLLDAHFLANTDTFNITVIENNAAPSFPAIADQAGDELTLISFSSSATDTDLPAQTLTYSIIDGLLAGMTMNTVAGTGTFNWTPTEAQGPGVYEVVIGCSDGIDTTFDTIDITVNEVNVAPVITTVGNQVVSEEALLAFSAAATDSDLPANGLTYTISQGQLIGMAIDGSGNFTWTPTEAQGPGVYGVVIRVDDDGTPALADSTTFNITVNELNSAPTLAAIGNQSIDELSTLSFTAVGTDPSDNPANNITYSIDAACIALGASIVPATGAFSWTPTEVQGPGAYNCTITITDDGTPNLTDDETISITVNEVNVAPTFAAIADQAGNELTLISFSSSATDTDLPAQTLTYSIVSGAQAGMTINTVAGTGTFNWTPTEAQGPGVYTVVIGCDDGVDTTFDSVDITVNEVNTAPVITNVVNQNVNETVLLNVSAAATDSDLPANTLTYTISQGLLAGMAVDGSGNFTWTPTEAQGPGVYTVTVRVDDDGTPSMADSTEFDITVNETNSAPVLSAIGAQSVDELATLNFTASGSDPSDDPANNLTYTIDAACIALGASIAPVTGDFSWTPTEAQGPGVYNCTVTVTDDGTPNLSDDEIVAITVNELNVAPSFPAIADQAGNELTLISFSSSATDTDLPAQTLTYSIVDGLLAGMSINTAAGTGTFSWTPTEAQGPGTYQVVIGCDDGIDTTFDTLDIVVGEVNVAPVITNVVNQNVDENNLLTVDASATDADLPANTLTYTISQGLLAGMSIDGSGSFTWTPTEAQGPGTYTVTVRVDDDGTPSLADSTEFDINVGETNQAPTLAAIGNQNIDELSNLAFTATADDLADTPQDGITFTIDATCIALGASMTVGGDFSWTPTEAQGPGVYNCTITATDDGTPNLTDDETISITVGEINAKPIAVDDSTGTGENLAVAGDLSTNDSDANDIPANTLGYTALPVSGPFNGGIVIDPTGTFTYTPTPGFSGADSVFYEVCDNGTLPLCDTAMLYITVLPNNNNAPVAIDDNFNTNEEVAVVANVTSNDTDADGNELKVDTGLVSGPFNGSVIMDSSGAFLYTPDLDFFGVDSFEYIVCDDTVGSLCDTGLVTITVDPINDNPVALNDTITILEDNIGLGDVSLNDSDVDGPALVYSFAPIAGPFSGGIILINDGTFTYTPTGNSNGKDSVYYRVCDTAIPGLCDSAWLHINVTPVNDLPIATLDNFAINEDENAAGDLSTNDTEPDGDNLVYDTVFVSGPFFGTASVDTNGIFGYTPNLNYFGRDSVYYRVCDDQVVGSCDSAWVKIAIASVNDSAELVDDTLLIIQSGAGAGDISLNDSDVDGDVLEYTPQGSLGLGIISLNSLGTYTYTSNGTAGTDIIDIEACDLGTPDICQNTRLIVIISPLNSAPLAVADTVQVNEDDTLSVTVLINDSEPDGDALKYDSVLVTGPFFGTATMDTLGNLEYIPNAHFFGADSLQYEVCDDAIPSLCDTAWVYIDVQSVNDAPVVLDDTITIAEEGSSAGDVSTNDSDVEGNLSYTPINSLGLGIISLNGNGTFTYDGNVNMTGTDTVLIEVCDNGLPIICDTTTLLVVITPDNDAPLALNDTLQINEDDTLNTDVSVNDSDPEGDNLVYDTLLLAGPFFGTATLDSNGNLQYIPTANFFGSDSIQYEVCDDGAPSLCDTAWVYIDVQSVNDAPIVLNDTLNILEGGAGAGDLSSNDSDVEGSLSYTPINSLGLGIFSLNGNGSYTYTGNPSTSGVDTITIEVCDTGLPIICDTSTLFVVITVVNDTPVALHDTLQINEDDTLITAISINDSDPNGDNLLYDTLLINGPFFGTAALDSNGNLQYIPTANFFGRDSLQYEVCDDGAPSLCDTAWVYIDIQSVNDAPIVLNDTLFISEGGSAAADLSNNDSDVEGSLTYTEISSLGLGVFGLNLDGSFTYTGNPATSGVDTILVEVCDNGLPVICDTSSFFVLIGALNDAPIALHDTLQVNEDDTLNAIVSGNDSDPEGDNLTYDTLFVAGPFFGTATLDTNGNLQYIPTSNFFGRDSLQYQVCDDGSPSLCDAAWVYIDVQSVNDAPVVLDDTITIVQEGTGAGDLSSNDLDLEGSLSYTPISSLGLGIFSLNGDGSFSYTGNVGMSGTDTISVEVCDTGLPIACDTSTLLVVITAGNSAPIAVVDSLLGTEDNTILGSLDLNDSDIDGDTLVFDTTLLVAASFGSVDLDSAGAISYTPNLNFNGTDSMMYRVCDTGNPSLCDSAWVYLIVSAVNDTPVGVVDNFTITEDSTLTTSLGENDLDVDGDSLIWGTSAVSGPSNGGVVISNGGSFTYTPTANFFGVDTFSYVLCDLPGLCDTGMVIINLTPTPDAPIAVDDIATVDTNSSAFVDVQVNDFDADGDSLITSIVTSPAHGTALVVNFDSIQYTPNATFNDGIDSLYYQVCDTSGLCDTALVVIIAPFIEFAPIATIDSVTINEDDSVYVAVLINDIEPNGDPLSIDTLINGPMMGTASIVGDSVFYKPNANYFGRDSIWYVICDTTSPVPLCDTGLVVVTVDPIPDSPIAVDDAASTLANVLVVVDVQSNDINVDEDELSTFILGQPARGTATLLDGDSISYLPDTPYSGAPDTITYRVCNQSLLCDTAVVIITVPETKVAPTAVVDSLTVSEDSLALLSLIANDFDSNGDSILLTSLSMLPVHGTIDTTGDSLWYVPNPDFNGADSMSYVVCDTTTPVALCDTGWVFITVTPVADAPVATNEGGTPISSMTVTTQIDSAISVQLYGFDVDGDLVDVTGTTSGPITGTVSDLATGDTSFTYTPGVGFTGVDTVSVALCDPTALCDTVMVIINVLPEVVANDLPVIVDTSGASADTLYFTGVEDKTTKYVISANDADLDTLDVTSIVNGPQNGSAFGFSDGDTTFFVTPDPDFNGNDTMIVIVCDTKGGCDSAVVIITVTPVNDLPRFVDETLADLTQLNLSTIEDSTTMICVDMVDIDLDPVDISSVISGPFNGGVTGLGDGDTCFSYSPTTGFTGKDTIMVLGCDDQNGCDTLTIVLTVTPEDNTAPIILDGGGSPTALLFASVNEDDSVFVEVNAIDNENDPVDVTFVAGGPSNGTITGLGDGDTAFTYTPNPNFNGTDTVRIQVCDIFGACDQAMWVILVSSVDDAPVILDAADQPTDVLNIFTSENTATLIKINGRDDDNDDIDVTGIVSGPGNGVITGLSNGDTAFTYVPTNGFIGIDTVEFILCDITLSPLCDTAIAIITVAPENNEPPRIVDTSGTDLDTILISSLEDFASFVQLTVVDTNNDSVDVQMAIDGPANGTITGLADGDTAFTYTPDLNFNGADTLKVLACDVWGSCDTAWVFVDITPVNDAPIVVSPTSATKDTLTISIESGMSTQLCISATDPEGDFFDVESMVFAPTNGSVTDLSTGDVCLTYSADSGFVGVDTFEVTVCDVLGACDSVVVVVDVTPINNAPDVLDFNDLPADTIVFTTKVDEALDACLNISDIDGDSTFVSATLFGPASGTTSGIGDGDNCFTYNPNAGFLGLDTMSVVVCDDGLPMACDTVVAIVVVSEDGAGNTGPNVVDDTAQISENGTVTINVLANDSDAEGDSLTVTSIGEASNGTAVLNADGTVTYTPDLDFFGLDSVTYTVCDDFIVPFCASATIYITVDPDRTITIYDGVSPNGDGKNDVFIVRGLEFYPGNEVFIHNRWGAEVYHQVEYDPDDLDKSWGGGELPDGTYFYVIKLNDADDQSYTGFIVLSRNNN